MMPGLIRHFVAECEYCGGSYSVSIRNGHIARRTCSKACAAQLGAVNGRNKQDAEHIEQAEIWRRAAVIRHNNLAQMNGTQQQPLDWL